MPPKFKPDGFLKVKPGEDLYWKVKVAAAKKKKEIGEYVIYCLEQATKNIKLDKTKK